MRPTFVVCGVLPSLPSYDYVQAHIDRVHPDGQGLDESRSYRIVVEHAPHCAVFASGRFESSTECVCQPLLTICAGTA